MKFLSVLAIATLFGLIFLLAHLFQEEYIYQEDSTYGIMEGTIRIKESRE